MLFKKCTTLLKVKDKINEIKSRYNLYKPWKKEELISNFAKVNLAITNGSFKIKKKISKIVMETEIQDKQNLLR